MNYRCLLLFGGRVHFLRIITRSMGIRKATHIPDMASLDYEKLKQIHERQGSVPKGVCSRGVIFPIDTNPHGQLQRVWILGEFREFFEKCKISNIKRKCNLSHFVKKTDYLKKILKQSKIKENYLFTKQSRLSKFRLGMFDYANQAFSIVSNVNQPIIYHPHDRTKGLMRIITCIQMKNLIRVHHHGSILVFQDQIQQLQQSRSILEKYFGKFLHQITLECFNRFWVERTFQLIPFITEISSHELTADFVDELWMQDVLWSGNVALNSSYAHAIGENELFELLTNQIVVDEGDSIHSLFMLLNSLNNTHYFRIGVGIMNPVVTLVLGQVYQSYAVGVLALEETTMKLY